MESNVSDYAFNWGVSVGILYLNGRIDPWFAK
jgi:hypothetical protein